MKPMKPMKLKLAAAATAAFAALLFVGASCNPAPSPSPSPSPSGTGYDCANPLKFTGLISVAHGLASHYIVVLKHKPAIQPLVSAAMTASGITEIRENRRGYAAKLAAAALAKILADPNVQYVQEDGVKSVSPRKSTSQSEASIDWGLDRLDQHDLPYDNLYAPGADATGVNVAIVDTGISPSPDFEGRLQLDCFSAVSGGCADGHGHGTHVSGTVAGARFGVAKKALLYAVRVLDASGSGSDSGVIAGIEWVTSHKQVNPTQDWVINLSLGGDDSPALNQAVCDAIGAGVTVAAAAGNESLDADTSSPGRVQQAVTVCASDRTDTFAYFSNFGPLIDLCAPGVDIESDQPDGSTAVWSGTSMATPHVAGAAALYLGRHPGASPDVVRAGLIASATVDHLKTLPPKTPNLLLYAREP